MDITLWLLLPAIPILLAVGLALVVGCWAD